MTQLQPAFLPHPPIQADRILRSTSGNANFQFRDGEGVPDVFRGDWGHDDSSDSDVEPELAAYKPPGERRSHNRPYSLHASVHAQQRESLRASRRNARRGYSAQQQHSLRLGPTGLPDYLYEATYEHKDTKKIITRIQRIPEAIQREAIQGGDGAERYREYLDRNRKDLGGDGKPVWTSETEEAFQHAVRVVPPVLGKKKVLLPTPGGGNKLLGRNELISIVIERLTGENRSRKQISSHKQVLKNFVIANQATFDFHADFYGINYATTAEIRQLKEANWEEKHSRRTWKWDDERCMLICTDFTSDSGPMATKSGYQLQNEALSGPIPRTLAGPSLASQGCIAQRMDFDMSLFTKEETSAKLVHRFTTIQSESGAQAKPLEEIPDWREFFPEFDALLKDTSMKYCDIVLLDSSLMLMERPRQRKCLLAINFSVDMLADSDFTEYHVTNTFYEDKGAKRDTHSKKIPHDRIAPHDTKRIRLFDIPLKAEWWTQVFSKIMECRIDKEVVQEQAIAKVKEEKSNDEAALAAAEEEARRVLAQEDSNSGRYLQEMSLMQEITGYRKVQGKVESKRIAVFLWRFRRTSADEIATTTWRRLNPPPSRIETNSPMPQLTQPPMTIDTNVLRPPTQPTSPEVLMEDPFSSHISWEQQWGDMHSASFERPENRPFQEAYGDYYMEPPQAQFAQPTLVTAPTVPSNDHLDPSFNSRSQNVPSPTTQPHLSQVTGAGVTPSESLGKRMRDFYGQQPEPQTRSSIDSNKSQAYSINQAAHFANQNYAADMASEAAFNLGTRNSISMHEATDPSLLGSFTGGQVQFGAYGHGQHQVPISSAGQEEHSAIQSFSTEAQQYTPQSSFDNQHSLGQSHISFAAEQQPHTRSQVSSQRERTSLASPHDITSHSGRMLQRDEDIYEGGDLLVHFSRSGQGIIQNQPWLAQQSQEQQHSEWTPSLLGISQDSQVSHRAQDEVLWFLRPAIESAGHNFNDISQLIENSQASTDVSTTVPTSHLAASEQSSYGPGFVPTSFQPLHSLLVSDPHLRVGIAFAMWRLDAEVRSQIPRGILTSLARAFDPSFRGSEDDTFDLFANCAAEYFAAGYGPHEQQQQQHQESQHSSQHQDSHGHLIGPTAHHQHQHHHPGSVVSDSGGSTEYQAPSTDTELQAATQSQAQAQAGVITSTLHHIHGTAPPSEHPLSDPASYHPDDDSGTTINTTIADQHQHQQRHQQQHQQHQHQHQQQQNQHQQHQHQHEHQHQHQQHQHDEEHNAATLAGLDVRVHHHQHHHHDTTEMTAFEHAQWSSAAASLAALHPGLFADMGLGPGIGVGVGMVAGEHVLGLHAGEGEGRVLGEVDVGGGSGSGTDAVAVAGTVGTGTHGAGSVGLRQQQQQQEEEGNGGREERQRGLGTEGSETEDAGPLASEEEDEDDDATIEIVDGNQEQEQEQ